MSHVLAAILFTLGALAVVYIAKRSKAKHDGPVDPDAPVYPVDPAPLCRCGFTLRDKCGCAGGWG